MQDSTTITRATARICNRKGLHARAAAKLVKTASDYEARVTITHHHQSAGATSILSLLMLAAEMGVELEVCAEGAQAVEASAAIVSLIERRFDEAE